MAYEESFGVVFCQYVDLPVTVEPITCCEDARVPKSIDTLVHAGGNAGVQCLKNNPSRPFFLVTTIY